MADSDNLKPNATEDATVVEGMSSQQTKSFSNDENGGQDEDSVLEDELTEEDDHDEDSEISLKDKILLFLKSNIPIIYNFYLKVTKQEDKTAAKELEDVEDEGESFEEEKASSKSSSDKVKQSLDVMTKKFRLKAEELKALLVKKIPALEKVSFLKPQDIVTEDAEIDAEESGEDVENESDDVEENAGKGKKKVRKPLLKKEVFYVICVGLFAWILFDPEFDPTQTSKDGSTGKTPVSHKQVEKVSENRDSVKAASAPDQTQNNNETPVVEPTSAPEVPRVEENSNKTPSENPAVDNSEVAPITSPDSSNPEIVATPMIVESINTETATATELSSDTVPSPEEIVPSPDLIQNQEAVPSPEVIPTPETVIPSVESQEPSPKMETTEPPSKEDIKKTKDLDTEIKDIIEKVEEKYSDKEDYESPPDYTKRGRGLVYNCKGKHWVCLNRVNYFQCRKNQLFMNKLKSPPDCVIFNVYATDEDCDKQQEQMIDKLIPVPACSGQ